MYTLNKYDMEAWLWFIWLKIKVSDRLLWVR
jgi:hypothetical protein